MNDHDFLVDTVLRTAGASVLLAERQHRFSWVDTGLVPRGLCSCGWLVVGPETEAEARRAHDRHVREAKGGAA